MGGGVSRATPPCSKATNPLTERCRVSNKQQWTGNPRFLIGFGDRLAGPLEKLRPLPVALDTCLALASEEGLETEAGSSRVCKTAGYPRYCPLFWLHPHKALQSFPTPALWHPDRTPCPGSDAILTQRGHAQFTDLVSQQALCVCPRRPHFLHDEAQSLLS